MARQTRRRVWILWIWNNKIIIAIIFLITCSLCQLYIASSNTTHINVHINQEDQIPTVHHRELSQTISPNIHERSPNISDLNDRRIDPNTPHCSGTSIADSITTNSKFKRLNISLLPQNWISFANRCQMNRDLFKTNIRGDFDFMWMNSEVGYLHNYKCGGSTVQDALSKLSSIDLRGESVYEVLY